MAHSEHTYKEPDPDVEKVRSSEEYEAGYQARFEDVPECTTATACWRAGWQEADRETAGAALPGEMLSNAEARVPWSLFGTGKQARAYNLPFDEFCPDSWKSSWVQADITLSLAARQRDA